MIKISLDLDGVCLEFDNYYNSVFGIPKSEKEITKNVYRVKNNKDFWLNQPILNKPDFTPHCYCTARINSKSLIKKQLEINKFPKANVYQIPGYFLSKASQLRKSGATVHIDDSLRNFIDLNSNGIPCLLFDSPANKDWGPIGRITDLEYDQIEETYNLFMDTIFPNFKSLL